jgi:hypothetical protein
MLTVNGVIRRFGETLREMGILVAVFAPLDALFAERNVSPQLVIAIAVAGLLVLTCGILIEESR